MPKSFVYRELVLHSPSVLLPRTARLYAKLTRGVGRVPKSLVYRELVLHSPSVMYASLRCKLAYITDKWVMKFGECLNLSYTENWFCIRLQFCTLRYQNWLEVLANA